MSLIRPVHRSCTARENLPAYCRKALWSKCDAKNTVDGQSVAFHSGRACDRMILSKNFFEAKHSRFACEWTHNLIETETEAPPTSPSCPPRVGTPDPPMRRSDAIIFRKKQASSAARGSPGSVVRRDGAGQTRNSTNEELQAHLRMSEPPGWRRPRGPLQDAALGEDRRLNRVLRAKQKTKRTGSHATLPVPSTFLT